MSFFTSFQELLDFDHSTNLNGFHFSNSLFGFDSNSLPTLENLPPPVPASAIPNTPTSLDPPGAAAAQPPPPPSPIPSPLLETPTKLVPLTPAGPQLSPEVALQQQQQNHHHYNHHVPQQQSPVATPLLPIVSKFQLKVTPNNEIYISNESGTFCELAGSFVPSSPLRGSPELVLEEEEEPVVPEPPKTLYCIERGGVKRPLSPSDRRYCNSGIFRSCGIDPVRGSPNKKKSTSSAADGHGPTEPEGAKLVVSNVINNGLIVNKKHLSTTQEAPAAGHQQPSVTPERRIMRPKKRKKKIPPKGAVVTLEAKLEPIQNGTRIVTKIAPKPKVAPVAAPPATPSDSNLNFSGIKEKAAQEAIFSERVEKAPIPPEVPVKKNGLNGIVSPSVTTVGVVEAAKEISSISGKKDGAVAEVQEIKVGEGVAATSPSSPAPVELKVVADLVMDKEVFGHVSLLNNSSDRSKTVIYQNPVTSRNVIYSILNPKSLNLALAGVDRSTTATLTLQPHRPGVRKPKKRGRKPKSAMVENPVEVEGATPAAPEPVDPNVPVMVTRSGRLSKPPRYANNFFQNMKQSAVVMPPQQLPPPPPPPPLPPPILPDPETAEKLPNFSAALSSAVVGEPAAATAIEQVQKRKMTVPLQYRCATCNKIYLGKRMQRHLQKYPSHNSARDCAGSGGGGGVTAEGGVGSEVTVKKDKEEKSTYLYKHLFDLLQRFTEKDKGRIMLKEISNFVDFVRALIPRLITNDEQNSTVEYIDHNVADVLRLNHGKYRLKLSSLAEEYEKLNLTVNLLEDEPPHSTSQNTSLPITSTPNADRQSGFSFNADDLLNQSSSFPSLTTLMHEHHVLNTMLAPAPAPTATTNNNHYLYNNNVPHQQQQSLHHSYTHHNLHHHHHHLSLIPEADGGVTPLAGLCKSPVQHHHHHHHVGAASAGMVNMALNLY